MIYLFWATLFSVGGLLLIIHTLRQSKIAFSLLFCGIFFFSVGLYGFFDAASSQARRRVQRFVYSAYEIAAYGSRTIKTKLANIF